VYVDLPNRIAFNCRRSAESLARLRFSGCPALRGAGFFFWSVSRGCNFALRLLEFWQRSSKLLRIGVADWRRGFGVGSRAQSLRNLCYRGVRTNADVQWIIPNSKLISDMATNRRFGHPQVR
jgi:hypothetical protein